MRSKHLSWLWTWLIRPNERPRLDLSFVLYTRAGCHLCDEAWVLLNEAQRRYRFALSAVNVDSDLTLRRLHGEVVPVVTIDGKVRFRGGVNRVLLKRLLHHEAEKARKSGRGLSRADC